MILTSYSILTTLLVGSLLMSVLVFMMPFLTYRHSMKIIVLASFLILLCSIFPYEFWFTHEVELIYGLPHIQTFLNYSLFSLFPVRNAIIAVWALGTALRFAHKHLNSAARDRRAFMRNCPK